MAGFESEVSTLMGLNKSWKKNRRKRSMSTPDMEDREITQESGIEEAISVLGGGDVVYSTDGNLIKNFSTILGTTGRETKENSKIYPVIQAVQKLNDKTLVSDMADKGRNAIRQGMDKIASEVVNTCAAYRVKVGNPWSTSGKQRKALVQAVETQVTTLNQNINTMYEGGLLPAQYKQNIRKAVKNGSGISWIDLVNQMIENHEAAMTKDVSNMSEEDRKALHDSIMKDYGLTSEEADRLMNNTQEIGAVEMYFGGDGAVTPELIKKLASQFEQKKDLQQQTGGLVPGAKDKERLPIRTAAFDAAKKECEERFHMDTKELYTSGNFIRVLTALLDVSGTARAHRYNVQLLRRYLTTKKNKDGGIYWELLNDFLNPDLSIFEDRSPAYQIAHHDEIHDACEVGSEVFQNFLGVMKKDTGVEPDEDTMNNINALASFLMDYTMYSAGIWEMYGSGGIDFFDMDHLEDYERLLQEEAGNMEGEGEVLSERSGVADGFDRRHEAYDNTHTGSWNYNKDMASMDILQTMTGFSNSRSYKIAQYKGSIKDMLVNIYGWKELPRGPRTKAETDDELTRKLSRAGLIYTV